MQAKCPECFGEKPDCEECCGTGYVMISMASGGLYTRHCTNLYCGFDNGGKIVASDNTKALENPPGPCVMCGSFTEWVYVYRRNLTARHTHGPEPKSTTRKGKSTPRKPKPETRKK